MCIKNQLDIRTWSARQLRNLLLQELAIDPIAVNRILDRKELKAMAERALFSKEFHDCKSYLRDAAMWTTMVCLVITTLIIFRRDAYLAFKYIASNFVNVYQWQYRFFVMRKSIKKGRSFGGFLAELIAFLCDFIAVYIQLSAILSWIVPAHWPVHNLLWFGVSLPVNANDILAQYSGNRNSETWKSSMTDSGSTQHQRGWSINAGPMITMSILRYAAFKLDEVSARWLMQIRAAANPVATFQEDISTYAETIDRKNYERSSKSESKQEKERNSGDAGRGHGYAAQYRNNTSESIKWLLPRKSSAQEKESIDAEELGKNGISGGSDDEKRFDSGKSSEPVDLDGHSSSADTRTSHPEYSRPLEQQYSNGRDEKWSNSRVSDADDGWASD